MALANSRRIRELNARMLITSSTLRNVSNLVVWLSWTLLELDLDPVTGVRLLQQLRLRLLARLTAGEFLRLVAPCSVTIAMEE